MSGREFANQETNVQRNGPLANRDAERINPLASAETQTSLKPSTTLRQLRGLSTSQPLKTAIWSRKQLWQRITGVQSVAGTQELEESLMTSIGDFRIACVGGTGDR